MASESPPTTEVSQLSRPTKDRFNRLRRESQDRTDRGRILNDEFVALLLDVFEHHLEAKGGSDG